MHASTASACLRKLSDWVNSVSNPHACSWSVMICYLFSPSFLHVSLLFVWRIVPLWYQIFLDFHRGHPADYASGLEPLPQRFQGGPLWQLPNLDGYNPCTCRFKGSYSLRSLPAGPISHFQ